MTSLTLEEAHSDPCGYSNQNYDFQNIIAKFKELLPGHTNWQIITLPMDIESSRISILKAKKNPF